MKKSNWKKYATSAALVALVGAGVAGSGINLNELGVNVGVIEAAPVATPVNIIAFDQFAITGSAFDPLANVSAFGVSNGEVSDLTASIEVVENTVNINEPGRYKVTYEATNEAGQKATDTINVVVDVNPSQALVNIELVLNDLVNITADLDINDEGVQEQIDTLRTQVNSLRDQYASIEAVVADKDTDITVLEERLLPLQSGLDELYTGTVTLFTAVSNLDESIEVHKALADAELARLGEQLDTQKKVHEEEVKALEDSIKASGDGEQVKELQKRVDESTARYEALTKSITDRIAEVTAEVTNLDYEDGKSAGRDEVLNSLIEQNEVEITELEAQIKAVKDERDTTLANLKAQTDGKLSDADLDVAKANYESAKTYFAGREKGLNDRLAGLKTQTDQLTADEAAYAGRIQQLRDQLNSLRNRERELEKGITGELNKAQEVENALEPVLGDADDKAVDTVVDAIVDGDLVDDEKPEETPTEPKPEVDETGEAKDDEPEKPTDVENPVDEDEKPEPTEPVEDVGEDPATPEPKPEPTDDDVEPTEPTDDKEPADQTDAPSDEGKEPAVDGGNDSSEPVLDGDVLVGGEDLGDDHVVYDEIPTIEDILGESDNVVVETGPSDSGESVPVPDADTPNYVETEHSAGAGESVVKAQTLSVSEVNALADGSAEVDESGKVTVAGATATNPEAGEGESEEKAKGGILPQTGAAYGALGLAGTGLFAAAAAWIAKRKRG